MLSQRNIEKWNLGYALLKPYIKLTFRLYFRNIYIRDKQNIPKDAPVIFAPNHQNALMDALAVLYAIRDQPVFLARADIFRNKRLARVLSFLKLMPVYRIRDGYNSLQDNNNEVVNKVSEVLSAKRYLVIFPEGNHGKQRKLRPLKKGICRMALQAEARKNFRLGIYVVPVGLDYENYYKFHKSLLIRFGKPISIEAYKEEYHANPSRAYNLLKNDISLGLKEVMLHVNTREYYALVNNLREIYRDRLKKKMGIQDSNHPVNHKADRQLASICHRHIQHKPEETEELQKKVRNLRKHLHKLNLQPWLFKREKHPIGVLLATFPLFMLFLPVFLYGLLNNAFPFFFPGLANKNVKDPQFYSSIRYGGALVLFPLFYLIQLIIFSQLADEWWLRLSYLLSLPITGYAAYQYYRIIKKTWAKLRYNWFRKKHPHRFDQLHRLREEIIRAVDRWVETSATPASE
ncbi:MAG: 1-acyl-sn-glycerol-3-phosphate acyltransferase [Bacteroidales bacterium]